MFNHDAQSSQDQTAQDQNLQAIQGHTGPGRTLQFETILDVAKEKFANIGVSLTGLHYRFAREQKGPGDGLFLSFDGTTPCEDFYGSPYSNQLRSFTLRFIYQELFDTVQQEFPGTPIWLDVMISNEKGASPQTPSPLLPYSNQYGFVDVTTDNHVEYISLDEAMKKGEIQPGSCLEDYCARYGDSMLLKHAGHYISPDPITLEMLEVIAQTRPFKSALEIGAGVGLSAKAAATYGVHDYHFVDLNADVVSHLNARYPGKATQSDALSYTFDKHYDLIQIGFPYELMPGFLERQGSSLAAHCDLVVFQSACLTFFELEHAWLMGDDRVRSWPWFKEEQTLGHYFPYVAEASHGFQSCIIASKQPLDDLLASMKQKGFQDHSFESIVS